MKELIIFRIFALFPLIGTLIPDITDKLSGMPVHLTAAHVIVDVTLAICIIICSVAIWMAKDNQLSAAY
jgi:hypothetical protein